MKTKLTIKGVKEEQQNLLQMPDKLAAEALVVVNEKAQEAAKEIRRNYPRKTGLLRKMVKVTKAKKSGAKRTAIATSTVVSGSHTAHLIEDGTVARHTSLGPEYGNRGMMYGLHVFWPVILRINRELQPQYAAILRAKKFVVTGSA